MIRWTILLLALSSFPLYAEQIVDEVDSVSEIQNGERLIYFTNGRVAFLPASEPMPEVGDVIEVETNDQNQIEKIDYKNNLSEIQKDEDYAFSNEPTVLESYSRANTLFSQMNRSWKAKTECTDRAHIWVYEDWKRHGLISQKVFLFFTNTYIRRYRYHWWFHVSPYVLTQTQTESETTERVMDRKYSSTPRTMKSWTDIFIRSKRVCPSSTYRHYRNNRNGSEHCYIVRSNMYNRLPLHVRNQEDSGVVKNSFSTSEVNFSYRAFTRRRN